MRNWMLLGLAAILLGVVGCTSAVHPSIRDDATDNVPTADSGVLPKTDNGKKPEVYGGDAAGTLNLDANAQAEKKSPDRG